jgi:hypothetical protein
VKPVGVDASDEPGKRVMVVVSRHRHDFNAAVEEALDAAFEGPERFVHLVLGVDDVSGQDDYIYFPVDRRLYEALPDVSHGEFIVFDWDPGRTAAEVDIASTKNLKGARRHGVDSARFAGWV